MTFIRFWIGCQAINFGLRVWPNGRAKSELTQLLLQWRRRVEDVVRNDKP